MGTILGIVVGLIALATASRIKEELVGIVLVVLGFVAPGADGFLSRDRRHHRFSIKTRVKALSRAIRH